MQLSDGSIGVRLELDFSTADRQNEQETMARKDKKSAKKVAKKVKQEVKKETNKKKTNTEIDRSGRQAQTALESPAQHDKTFANNQSEAAAAACPAGQGPLAPNTCDSYR